MVNIVVMTKFYERAGILGSLIILFTIAYFSLSNPSYSHAQQTISELNARGSSNAFAMNIFYTMGFISIAIFSVNFIRIKNNFSYFAGILMLIAALMLICLNWFFPMDPWQGIRTANDQLHNNVITWAVIVFLLSQFLQILYFMYAKQFSNRKIALILFGLAVVFGLMSLWSNIYQSELINFSERGWMVSFLIYLAWLPVEK
jgi:hypothetical membrane protein